MLIFTEKFLDNINNIKQDWKGCAHGLLIFTVVISVVIGHGVLKS